MTRQRRRFRSTRCTASTQLRSLRRPTRRRSVAVPIRSRRFSAVPCPCCHTARAKYQTGHRFRTFEIDDSYEYEVTPMSQSSILSMLHGRASLRPNDVAFTFTDYEKDYAGVPENLTWSQLSRRTMNVAREILLHGSVGDMAVILAPQGLDYILAFLGSMQSGVVAVPLPLPHRGSSYERVRAVFAD